MKLVKPSVEDITPSKYDLTSIYKHIERCGRTCYQSFGNITEDSYEKFLAHITDNAHGSVLEHGSVYLTVPIKHFQCEVVDSDLFECLLRNPYTRTNSDEDFSYITTNMRVIRENELSEVLEYRSEPCEHHVKRKTFRIIADRGVTAEANRHRVNSPSEQSTRYCNFSKDKYGNEIGIMQAPEFSEEDIEQAMQWWKPKAAGVLANIHQDTVFREMCFDISSDVTSATANFDAVDYWLFANMASEFAYMGLLRCGWKPQQARRVLPLDLKSELVVTAFEDDWEKFLKLRSPKAGATGVHPDMETIADMIYSHLHN